MEMVAFARSKVKMSMHPNRQFMTWPPKKIGKLLKCGRFHILLNMDEQLHS